jgi:hypothetical protein
MEKPPNSRAANWPLQRAWMELSAEFVDCFGFACFVPGAHRLMSVVSLLHTIYAKHSYSSGYLSDRSSWHLRGLHGCRV